MNDKIESYDLGVLNPSSTVHKEQKIAPTCIYCRQENKFNVEHVIPKSLGTFKNSPTLLNIVCEECNSKFAKTFEYIATRDSYLLAYRKKCALTSINSLKHNRVNTRILACAPGKDDIEIMLQLKDGQEQAIPCNTLTVYNSTRSQRMIINLKRNMKDDYIYQNCLPICHNSRLESLGLYPRNGYVELYIDLNEPKNQYPNAEDTELVLLKSKEIKFFLEKTDIKVNFHAKKAIFNQENSIREIHFISISTSDLSRLIAKISFNYYLYHNHKIMLQSYFDKIINYINNGGESDQLIYFAPGDLINSFTASSNPTYIHVLFLFKTEQDELFVIISLFNEGVFAIKVSSYYPYQIIGLNQVSIFNTSTKEIVYSSLPPLFTNDINLWLNKLINLKRQG